PTASKLYVSRSGEQRAATIAEMIAAGGRLVRLQVPEHIARHMWSEHRSSLGQLDPRLADALEASAIQLGSDPTEWRVSYQDVPVSEILAVEASEDGENWAKVGVRSSASNDLLLRSDFIRSVFGEPPREGPA